MKNVRPGILSLESEVVSLRREIHRNPELAFCEHRTSRLVAEKLRAYGLEVTGVAKTGVLGVLRGNGGSRTILVRADMDGLPIQEANPVEYRSRTNGVMHACGHDGHVAIALGTAKYLAGHREQIPGTVKFAFQPAEEKGGGAAPMIEAGAMENPKVDAVLALHLANEYPVGTAAVEAGSISAQVDEFVLEILGKGGHGAYPHQAIDPVVAAAQTVIGLNLLLSRSRDPLEPVVLSIGRIEGGKAPNVIPASVILEGTVRTFSSEVRKDFLEKIEKVVQGVAAGSGVRWRFQLDPGYPPCVNDPAMTELVSRVARRLLGEDAFRPARGMGAEDMAYFLQAAPGCIFGLGSNSPDHAFGPHHSPNFDFDERALLLGIEMFVSCIEEYLGFKA